MSILVQQTFFTNEVTKFYLNSESTNSTFAYMPTIPFFINDRIEEKRYLKQNMSTILRLFVLQEVGRVQISLSVPIERPETIKRDSRYFCWIECIETRGMYLSYCALS
jgi:hypothetical protein